MATKLRPDGGTNDSDNDSATGFLARVADISQTRIDNPVSEGMNTTRWIQAIMETLDANFRSNRNGFESGALVDVGTTEHTLPRLGQNGKIAAARLARTRPARKVTSGTFTAGQIPKMFAGEVRPGHRKLTGQVAAARLYDLTRNLGEDPTKRLGLPARKIRTGRLTADQLPVGYLAGRTMRATEVAGGVRAEDALQDADGNPVGLTSAFAFAVRPTTSEEDERDVYQVRGFPNDNDVLRCQIQTIYYRHGATADAGTGDEWINGPPARLLPDPDENGNGNGPNGPVMPPPGNGNGNGQPPPHG